MSNTYTEVGQLPRLISVQGLAASWSVRPGTIREWARTGKLPAPVRIGRKLLFRVDDLRRLLDGTGSNGASSG